MVVSAPPSTTRQAKLFRNNRSQAVRIPADWELPGTSVAIRRDGERLILEPLRPRGILGLLSSWDAIDEALPEPLDPVPAPEPDLWREPGSVA